MPVRVPRRSCRRIGCCHRFGSLPRTDVCVATSVSRPHAPLGRASNAVGLLVSVFDRFVVDAASALRGRVRFGLLGGVSSRRAAAPLV